MSKEEGKLIILQTDMCEEMQQEVRNALESEMPKGSQRDQKGEAQTKLAKKAKR